MLTNDAPMSTMITYWILIAKADEINVIAVSNKMVAVPATRTAFLEISPLSKNTVT